MNVQMIHAGLGFGMQLTPSRHGLLALSVVIAAIVGFISILLSLAGGELMATRTHADMVAITDARHISQAAIKAKQGLVPGTATLANTQIDKRTAKFQEEENGEPQREYESTVAQTIRIVRDVSLVAAAAFGWD